MAQMSQMSQVDTTMKGNTKPSSRSRKWVGTHNNYTEEEYVTMSHDFRGKGYVFMIGKEVGENGTPHLQIYIEDKHAIRFSTLKRMYPKVHWEKARGNREQNAKYCSKEGNYIEEGMVPLKNKLIGRVLSGYTSVKWKDWQQKVIDYIESPADDRKVMWIWDEKGNSGKSFLAKYIVCKYGAIIADGKKDNVFNQVNTALIEGKEPKIVILDIPRHNLDYVNYGMIEQLKNGMIYSGKYEGGVCIFESPHIVIFANKEPEKNKLSADRWIIIEI